jgi:hypothetical protein
MSTCPPLPLLYSWSPRLFLPVPQTVVHAATHTQTCSTHAWGCVQSMLSIACSWPAVAVSEMRLALRCVALR